MVAIIYEFNWKQYVSATTYIKLEEENRKLKYVIDTLMEKTCIDHITLASWEVFLNPSKRLKFNTDFMEEDTLQELKDLGKI
jgi:hypothetical protein